MRPSKKRAAEQRRLLSRVRRGFQPGTVADPLKSPQKASPLAILGFVLAAAAAHALFLGVFYASSSLAAELREARKPRQNIEVVIQEAPPKPKAPQEPEVKPEAKPEVKAEPKPEPKPEVKPEPKPKPKARPKRRKRPAPPPPPPDPVDLPEKEPEKPKEPVRRIVGLSLGSTSKGSQGPGYAVGNTRMGQTERVAASPEAAKPLAKTRTPPPKTRVNQRATQIPTSVQITRPKAKRRVTPRYPPDLRAQGVEGKVVVQVVIGKDGRVERAKVIRSSGYAAFDKEAIRAAQRELWEPARRAGQLMAYTLSFTTYFRLED